MSWSLGEVEALARKAARGAGYPWGLADEAGRATRHACAFGWDGPIALAQWLASIDPKDLAQHRPTDLNQDHWSSAKPLCPITTGAALSDLARRWAGGDTLTLGPLAQPRLLVPFMVQASKTTGAGLSLTFADLTLWHGSDGLHQNGDLTALDQITLPGATLTPHASPPPKAKRIAPLNRATPNPESIATLTRLAARTYAPDTDTSRLSGAGAGLSDND